MLSEAQLLQKPVAGQSQDLQEQGDFTCDTGDSQAETEIRAVLERLDKNGRSVKEDRCPQVPNWPQECYSFSGP